MLDHQTVLVVEQEFLIALDLQRMLESHGAVETTFARSPDEAFAQEKSWGRFSLAIVELRHGENAGYELAQRLKAAGIALIICTADSALRRGTPGFTSVPVVIKPVLESELASAIAQALAGRPDKNSE